VQLSPLWGRSASPKGMIYHDLSSELRRILPSTHSGE
jgi:hypothetical protein